MVTIQTEIAIMSYDEREQILHIEMVEGAEMDIENTRLHYETIKKLTGDKPYYALINAAHYFTIGPEVLKYASLPATLGKRLATAHYNPAFANKLTTNFFKTFYKPPIPVQVFETKEEAAKWLKTLKAEQTKTIDLG